MLHCVMDLNHCDSLGLCCGVSSVSVQGTCTCHKLSKTNKKKIKHGRSQVKKMLSSMVLHPTYTADAGLEETGPVINAKAKIKFLKR